MLVKSGVRLTGVSIGVTKTAVDEGSAAMIWEFVLKFRLPESGQDPSTWLDALFEAGCDDATVGVGRIGSVALDFSREALSAEEALRSAIADVQAAIPGSFPIEVGPDLVNLADLAKVVGCSRQNLRKYAAGEIRTLTVPFPEPVFSGNPSLWRLAEVGAWLDRFTDLHPPKAMIEIGRVTSALNLNIQHRRLHESFPTG